MLTYPNQYLSALVADSDLILWGWSVYSITERSQRRGNTKDVGIESGQRLRGSQIRSLHLAIVEVLQNLRESNASCVLDRLLLALTLLPLICASSSLDMTLARALHPRRHASHGPPRTLLPLIQAQLSAVTASRARG